MKEKYLGNFQEIENKYYYFGGGATKTRHQRKI
jgi:hypothetical protein